MHLIWQALRFNAYFKDTVYESRDEFYRVRPVDLYYFLEDDSIGVYEPLVVNSGIPQGTHFMKNTSLINTGIQGEQILENFPRGLRSCCFFCYF